MFANVLLPAFMFFPPAFVAVLVCEIGVYWLLLRRAHRFWRVVRVVILVNVVSTLFGWVVYRPATVMPSPDPMEVVPFRSDERSPQDRVIIQRVITEQFALACGLSIVIEGLALLVFGWEFPWRRLGACLLASNTLSYVVLWVSVMNTLGGF